MSAPTVSTTLKTREYREEATITGHRNTVNAITFSPDGRYLLSGGDDGILRVFELTDDTFGERYQFRGLSSITAVAWMESFPGTFIAGDRLGDLHTVHLYGERKATEWCHEYEGPIHCILTNSTQSLVALGHSKYVTVERRTTPSAVEGSVRLPDPPTFPELEYHQLGKPKARSIHFDPASNLLVVTYLEHGIVAWNITTNDIIWRIYPRAWRMGASALSPDGRILAVTNLFDGLDWYSATETTQRSRHLKTSIHSMSAGANVVLPVMFVHDGEDVLSGGTSGGARITSVTSGQTVQLLKHGAEDDLIQAVAYHKYDTVERIATANAEKGIYTTIKLWVYQSPPADDRSNKSTLPKARSYLLSKSPLLQRDFTMILLTVLVGAIAISAWYHAFLYMHVKNIWHGAYTEFHYPSATSHHDAAIIIPSEILSQRSKPSVVPRSTKRSTSTPTRPTANAHLRLSPHSLPQHTVTIERTIAVERTVTETMMPTNSIGHAVDLELWEGGEEYAEGYAYDKGDDEGSDTENNDERMEESFGDIEQGAQYDFVHATAE